MNKKMLVIAGAMAIATFAVGQSNGPAGVSARIGAAWPSQGADTVLAAGLDYKFKSIGVEQARNGYLSYLGLSVDYYGENNDNMNIPIALNYNVRNNQLVFTAGISYDMLIVGGNRDNGLGGQIGVAYDFPESSAMGSIPLFLAAKYFFAHNTDASALGLYLGGRF